MHEMKFSEESAPTLKFLETTWSQWLEHRDCGMLSWAILDTLTAIYFKFCVRAKFL
jgi:hypothetical protein